MHARKCARACTHAHAEAEAHARTRSHAYAPQVESQQRHAAQGNDDSQNTLQSQVCENTCECTQPRECLGGVAGGETCEITAMKTATIFPPSPFGGGVPGRLIPVSVTSPSTKVKPYSKGHPGGTECYRVQKQVRDKERKTNFNRLSIKENRRQKVRVFVLTEFKCFQNASLRKGKQKSIQMQIVNLPRQRGCLP